MRTPEGKLKDKVKAYLKEKGAYYTMPVPSGYGMPMLDFVGCYKGKFFSIETKAPGKRPTPRQQQTLSDIQFKGGGFATWADSWEGLKPLLDTFFV